jgi:hypothetical protein
MRHRLAGLTILLTLLSLPVAAQDPVPVVMGVATLAPEDFQPDPQTGLMRARLAFPDRPPPRLLMRMKRPKTPEGRLLAQLLSEGAAGNHGDLYDNRDRGHSPFGGRPLPTLSMTAYTEAALARGLDYGLNAGLLFDTITIGNSSTAIKTNPVARSLPRYALTRPGLPMVQNRLYESNHLYVYPEHRDHDPARGDLFPAAVPFLLVSQGSSGSDGPLLKALAMALAALRPETKAVLRAQGLAAPTLQMLLRRSMAGIETDADYLSGRAHPSVFDGSAIDFARLMRRAADLEADAVPPMVRLHVRASPEEPGEVFADGLDERLFDTPGAIARIARGTAQTRRWRVSTAGTMDPSGRPLTFHWQVLRGPGVRVTPLDDKGTQAVIEVQWTDPYPVPGQEALATQRIDVGVFADNGKALSAPAFFSVAFPPTERRLYDETGRLREIAYDPPDMAETYADPLLHPRRGWRDRYSHDAEGEPTGWIRTFPDGAVQHYTAHGLLVLETDAAGRATLAEAVAYPRRQGSARDGRERVAVTPTGRLFRYRYDGPEDRVGTYVTAE